jgi:hypothetical protein
MGHNDRLHRSQVKNLARLGYLIEAAVALARKGRKVVIQADNEADYCRLRKLIKLLHLGLTAKIRVSCAHGQALMAQQVAEARKVRRGTRPKRVKNPRPRSHAKDPAMVGRAELLRLLAEVPRPVDDYDLELTEDLCGRQEIEFTDPRAGPIKMILTPKGHRAVRHNLIAPPPGGS